MRRIVCSLSMRPEGSFAHRGRRFRSFPSEIDRGPDSFPLWNLFKQMSNLSLLTFVYLGLPITDNKRCTQCWRERLFPTSYCHVFSLFCSESSRGWKLNENLWNLWKSSEAYVLRWRISFKRPDRCPLLWSPAADWCEAGILLQLWCCILVSTPLPCAFHRS